VSSIRYTMNTDFDKKYRHLIIYFPTQMFRVRLPDTCSVLQHPKCNRDTAVLR